MKRTYIHVLSLAIGLLGASVAQAAGYEIMPLGARAAGRAGAVVASEDSPLALLYNPAQLAGIPRYRLSGSVNIHFSSQCFDRDIVSMPATSDTEPDIGTPQRNACSRGLAEIPQLTGSLELAPGLVLGIGVLAPPAVRGQKYENGELELSPGDPNPVRYSLLNQDLFQVFPTVGLGWEIVDGLRLGAAFGWGMTIIENETAAFAGALGDNIVHVEARDLFVPRATASVHYTLPDDLGLELGAMFSWTDDVKTGLAHFAITSGALGVEVADIPHVWLRAPQTYTLGFGVRYAMKLDQPVDDLFRDRLSTERFDVEANLQVVGSSRVDAIHINLPNDATILGALPVPDEVTLPHRFKNQVVLRVGSDLTIVPGLLAARVGYSYESNGVTRGYETLDFWNLRRYGLYAGVTLRIAKRLDVSIAYAHVFSQSVTNDGTTARLTRNVSDPTMPATQPQTIINAGTFRANYDALMLELGAAF